MNSVSKLSLYCSLFFSASFITSCVSQNEPPKVTVIFVIDQCPYHTLTKLLPFMKGGLKQLANRGISFTNAHHPNGKPGTFTGHNNLNTGTNACEHGCISNSWYDAQGNKIVGDDGDPIAAAVFSPNGLYDYGKSPQNIMVDGISDQFMLASSDSIPHHAISISGKSRSAIATANNALALWFDNESGRLTSSKAYYDELPEWVNQFNTAYAITSPTVFWTPCYNGTTGAYCFNYINDYRFSRKKSIVGKELSIGPTSDEKKAYSNFELTPHANKFILDAALACAQQHVHSDKPDRLLLWVCLSSLDKVGHRFGPWSREYIDMLYHLDKDIGVFMHDLEQLINKDEILFVLTSDHGIPPLIEHVKEKGLRNLGHLISSEKLVDTINNHIEQQYGIHKLVYAFINHQLYIDIQKLDTLTREYQKKVIKDIQLFLEKTPGVKKVWTPRALQKQSFPCHSAECYFQQQLCHGRSGQLIVQTQPYTCITPHAHGISHNTPHTHNTHVPLIFYRPGITQPKKIRTRVHTLQLANTLAELLEVPQPSASYADVLPHVLD